MTKYTEQFKLEVVQDYLSSGSAVLRAVAQRYGIPSHFMVRKWVLAHQVHGNVGQSGKRSQYSAEFKLSVLQYMWDNQLSMLHSAVKFNIRDHGMVGRWEHAYREGGFEALAPRSRGKPKLMATAAPKSDGPIDDDKRSREELLAEVNQLRMELAYLKKLEALVQARPKQAPKKKAQVVQELRRRLPMAGLLKLAKLARSTFYYQLEALQAEDKYQQIKQQIRTLFDRHKGRYGYRRITAGLCQLGHQINQKTVQRLMGVLGLKSLVRPKKYRSFKGEVGQSCAQ